MPTKFKIKFRVTNKNIRLRYLAEKAKGKGYSFTKMAEQFGMFNIHGKPDRPLMSKWASLDPVNQRLPNRSKKCPGCHTTVLYHIEKWINDGSLD